MKKSQIIGSFWIFLILLLACVVGLSGRAYLGDVLTTTKDGNTLVFINMVRNVCVYIGDFIGATGLMLFLAGLLLSAILASAMSTADSQLLASSSAFASDLYKPLIRKNASDNEMLWAGRAIVLVISVVAFFIAANPQCKGIMNLVSCAWAAFGSAFGPVVILALYWKRLTYNGAFAGIVAGFAMNIVWYNLFAAKTGIYEIVPGFVVGFIATYVVSLIDKAPSAEVVELFNKAKEQTADVENNKVIINGCSDMKSNELYPKDLRAAASLLIECIIDQKSELHNLYYLERGYDSIYKKLKKIGLKFELE
jgi:sodium/proline symporter